MDEIRATPRLEVIDLTRAPDTPAAQRSRGRVAVSALYLVAGSIIANLALFLSSILMARSFDPGNYGLITLVLSTNSLFLLIADMGIPMAVTKFVAEEPRNHQRVSGILSSAVTLTGGFSLVAMALFVILSSWLATAVFHADIGPLLRMSSVWIACTLLHRVLIGVFNGLQHMGYSFASTLLLSGLRFLSLIGAIYLELGVSGVIAGWSVAFLLALLLQVVLLIRFLHNQGITLRWSPGLERQLFMYGVYLALPFLGTYLIPYLLNMTMGWLSAAENVALLAVSLSLASLSFAILTPASNALLALASEAFANKDRQRMRTVGVLAFKYLWLISFGCLCMLAFFGKKLTALFYGPEYVAAGPALAIMAFAVFFESAKVVTDPLLNGTKYARTVTKIEFLKFALIAGLGSIFIYLNGITGAGLAILIAYAFSSCLKVYQVHRKLDIDLSGTALRFIPLLLVLAVFVWLGLAAWAFVVFAVLYVLSQKMLTLNELRSFLAHLAHTLRFRGNSR